MRKKISLLLVIVLLISLSACGKNSDLPATSSPEVTLQVTSDSDKVFPGQNLVILYTNDIHCGVEYNIGLKGLALIKNALERSGKQVLLVDSGDEIQGGPYGTLSNGKYLIEIMNELGYAVATPGNHEFDYGMDTFFYLQQCADFPYVSANFTHSDGSLVLDPYVVIESDGAKIAFVGVSTPWTIVSSIPEHFMDDGGNYEYDFCQSSDGSEFYASVQAAVDSARADGADYVIVLSHLGVGESLSPYSSSDLIEHTFGIDAVLDGHSHSVVEHDSVKNAEGKNVILTQTGTKMQYAGCLTFGKDGKISTSLISTGSAGEFIDSISAELSEKVNEVVAHTDVDLTTTDPVTGLRIVRTAETNLGDLCADAARAASGADIAFSNGGGIRANIPAGDITYGQIISAQPFQNNLSVVEATGQQILDALELSVSRMPDEFGGFLQVSGIRFTIDMSVESSVVLDKENMFVCVDGERRVKDVFVGDAPLDPNKTYTVAALSNIINSKGDGYSMFAGNNYVMDRGILDTLIFINYIQNVLGGNVGEGYSDPYGSGRITVAD